MASIDYYFFFLRSIKKKQLIVGAGCLIGDVLTSFFVFCFSPFLSLLEIYFFNVFFLSFFFAAAHKKKNYPYISPDTTHSNPSVALLTTIT